MNNMEYSAYLLDKQSDAEAMELINSLHGNHRVAIGKLEELLAKKRIVAKKIFNGEISINLHVYERLCSDISRLVMLIEIIENDLVKDD